MELKNFYSLADQANVELNRRNLLTGSDYEKFLTAASRVGARLVNSSGTAPYTEASFWPAVETIVTGWGKDPVNDMAAREMALSGLVYPLTAPVGIIDQIINQASSLIASQQATNTTVESSVQELTGNPAHLILSSVASGLGTGESIVMKLLTSADAQNFVTKSIATISTDGTYEYFIDTLTIPKFYKVIAIVTGTATISVINSYKY